MYTSWTRNVSIVAILMISFAMYGCSSGKYDRLPQATKAELEATRERFLALTTEAKKIEEKNSIKLLHHFSHAAISQLGLDDYKSKAATFIQQATSGKLESITFKGARSPGKVRLLLLDTPTGRRTVPFVRGSDGWVIDDIDLAFLSGDKEPNLNGTMPASSPSVLISIVTLQNVHSTEATKVSAAFNLTCAKCGPIAKSFLSADTKPWLKTALQHAIWKTGGACEPFASAFPIDKESQESLYQADSRSFRTLLQGLVLCAASSKSIKPTIKIYQGCHKVEGGVRSEYVDFLVGNPNAANDALKQGLGNLNPKYLLKTAVRLNIPYEEDPVANILVGGLHGEKETNFYKYIQKVSRSKGKVGQLAKSWVTRMSQRDEMEPVE